MHQSGQPGAQQQPRIEPSGALMFEITFIHRVRMFRKNASEHDSHPGS